VNVKFLSVFAAVAVVGCTSGNDIDVKREAARLLQTDREFAAASLEHGAADAFRMYLDEEAIMFSDGRHPVSGRGSIYEVMKAGGEGYILEWTPRAADVARSGEMGWTWGEYVVKSPGEVDNRPLFWGKYVNVWRKNDAGEWKVVADIGNDSPPPDSISEE
jgi:ketosteroid isomerase-like protein